MSTTVLNFHVDSDDERTRISVIAGDVQRWAVPPPGQDHLVAVAISGLTDHYSMLLDDTDLIVSPDLDKVRIHADLLRERYATMLMMVQLGNLAVQVDSPDRTVTDEEKADAMRRAGWFTAEELARADERRNVG